MSSLRNLLSSTFPFRWLLRPAQSAPWSLELPGRGGDDGVGVGKGALSAAVARRSQPQARDACLLCCGHVLGKNGGSIPPSKERLPECPRALQDFPGLGAGAAESRVALPGLLAGACQVGQLGRPHPQHTGARALSSALSGFHGTGYTS